MFEPNLLVQGPTSKCSHILRCWRSGLHRELRGDTVQPLPGEPGFACSQFTSLPTPQPPKCVCRGAAPRVALTPAWPSPRVSELFHTRSFSACMSHVSLSGSHSLTTHQPPQVPGSHVWAPSRPSLVVSQQWLLPQGVDSAPLADASCLEAAQPFCQPSLSCFSCIFAYSFLHLKVLLLHHLCHTSTRACSVPGASLGPGDPAPVSLPSAGEGQPQTTLLRCQVVSDKF